MSNSFIIFDGSSLEQHSGAFPVNPGSTVILSAWNLPKYVELTPTETENNTKPRNSPMLAIVQKMAFSTGEYPESMLCNSDGKFLLPQIDNAFVEDVTGCGGVWNLSACQNLVAINIPGTYRIFLNDPAAIGNVYITGQSILNSNLLQAPNLVYLS